MQKRPVGKILIEVKNTHKLLFLILFLSKNLSADSSSLIQIPKKKNHRILREYHKVHQKFIRELCPQGEEEYFKKLYRDFRSDGWFLPVLPDRMLDRITIYKYIPEIKKKKVWLNNLLQNFSYPNLEEVKQKISNMEKKIKRLLFFKYQFSQDKQKKLFRQQSKKELQELIEEFQNFLKKIPFLLSYRFPVDHFQLRKDLDTYKKRKDLKSIRAANSLHLLKTILEDGTQNSDSGGSDRHLRANLDNITLNFSQSDFLTENLRYDLVSAFNDIVNLLKRGEKNQLTRLQEWRNRTERSLIFYSKFKNNQSKLGDASQLKQKIFNAHDKLREFNRKKKEQVYRFWIREDSLMRILYVIETILYNETGGIDGRDALDRKDITQLVINRSRIPFYSSLSSEDDIFVNLKENPGNLDRYKWLNVLFKKREFTFTYYPISFSFRVYCPNMTRWGKSLRNENLIIALTLLRNPNNTFKAVRFFTRHSMLGRIDMGILWKGEGFIPLPERPGNLAVRRRYLRGLYNMGNFDYLYGFTGPNGQKFKVVAIKGKNYVIPLSNKALFYRYRNPHFFRYFKAIY